MRHDGYWRRSLKFSCSRSGTTATDVIELGRALSPLPESAHSEADKVQGCASQVWLLTHVKPSGSSGPMLTFEGDSDAHIVRGLIAILFALFSGKSAQEILDIDAMALFDRLGLRGNLRLNAQTVCA